LALRVGRGYPHRSAQFQAELQTLQRGFEPVRQIRQKDWWPFSCLL